NIAQAAQELINAFQNGRWERYAPENELPKSSSITLLGLQPQQWANIYERCDNFLNKPEKSADNNSQPQEENHFADTSLGNEDLGMLHGVVAEEPRRGTDTEIIYVNRGRQKPVEQWTAEVIETP